jgi:hypothetical protein
MRACVGYSARVASHRPASTSQNGSKQQGYDNYAQSVSSATQLCRLLHTYIYVAVASAMLSALSLAKCVNKSELHALSHA